MRFQRFPPFTKRTVLSNTGCAIPGALSNLKASCSSCFFLLLGLSDFLCPKERKKTTIHAIVLKETTGFLEKTKDVDA